MTNKVSANLESQAQISPFLKIQTKLTSRAFLPDLAFSRSLTRVGALAIMAGTLNGCNITPSQQQEPEVASAPIIGTTSSAGAISDHLDHDHWTYKSGHWGGVCDTGKHQSPIDIPRITGDRVSKNSLEESISIVSGPLALKNNGHAIQADLPWPFSTISVDKKLYDLIQFHFHSPSEHTLDGVQYPLEIHLVHKSPQGGLVVAGVLFKEGTHPNPMLEDILENAPVENVEKGSIPSVNLSKLLPHNASYYKYEGSLTTPPCTENVTWFVRKEVLEIVGSEVVRYRNLMKGEPTNRPVQPIGERVIVP